MRVQRDIKRVRMYMQYMQLGLLELTGPGERKTRAYLASETQRGGREILRRIQYFLYLRGTRLQGKLL